MNLKIEELGLEKLSNEEVQNINAGESGWYWLIRDISHHFYHSNSSSTTVYTDGSVMFY
ncbi:hypothetical protein [Flavobacterium sp. CAN_S2]|jgi:hypothetical protein|uniref:hypothetical protein n=1 Tax=Flavobacterium sp. CAN_S2 TaxID=2787726 RepID=UPI0018CB2FD4